MTKVINLFAGPGAGKSTTAAGLFFELKTRNIKCELVTEYAKDMTYEKRFNTLQDQLYILAKQNQRIKRLQGVVDYIVTDSPLIIGLAYTPKDYFLTFKPFVLDLFNSYNNENVFLMRTKKYQSYGRNQTEAEAKEKDEDILNLLAYIRKSHIMVQGDKDAPTTILKYLGIFE
jgi:hypothetical protein